MNLTPDTKRCIDVCNTLLRGELSAIETYSDTIHKHGEVPEVVILKTIRDEHIDSAHRLRKEVQALGGAADCDSGAWGDLTKAIQGTANFFGEGSAIASLKQGEEIGKSMYEKALENLDVMTECKEIIRSHLLPRVSSHLLNLEALQKRANH